jgi:hypothetical protein
MTYNFSTDRISTQSKEQMMYGCNIVDFVESVKESTTYAFSGIEMVIAGLLSDAQEQMSFDDTESARKTLNKAKHLIFLKDG